MEHIGIVTVLYNSLAVLPDFFRSLNEQAYRDFTLYVVDNASPDDSFGQARALADTVDFRTVFIRNTINSGIAQGNNIGIYAARQDGCEWMLLSNNDTVWSPDTLALLVEKAGACRAQITVPKILCHDTGKTWYAGGSWNRLRGGTMHHKADQVNAPSVTEYAPSCCMLIRRSVFDRIGVMDERFFIYYDDSDFVRRAYGAGISIWYIPHAVISHKEGSSTGAVSPTAQYWLCRNLLLFTGKHESALYWNYVLAVNLLILLLKRPFTFRWKEWLAAWQGIRDGVIDCRKNRWGTTAEKA